MTRHISSLTAGLNGLFFTTPPGPGDRTRRPYPRRQDVGTDWPRRFPRAPDGPRA